MNRREFLKSLGQTLGGVALFGGFGWMLKNSVTGTLPVIDPAKCVGCGRCASACIFTPSAIKCYNVDEMCSHCTACYGYHVDCNAVPVEKSPLVCPQNAIIRTTRPPEAGVGFCYTIDKEKCNGCGRCAKLCWQHGSKSMRLVVQHDICRRCNQCQIGRICEGGAFSCQIG